LPEPPSPQPVYNTRQIAQAAGVTVETVRAWVKGGRLKAITLGDGPKPRYRVTDSAWQAFVESRSRDV
jgi:predicted site-specific integrase-resolvase